MLVVFANRRIGALRSRDQVDGFVVDAEAINHLLSSVFELLMTNLLGKNGLLYGR